jgi:hypothetical protein
MDKTLRVLVLVLVYLTLVATPAWAECAWVLWGQTPSSGGFMSHPMDAFKTREECNAERLSSEAKMKAAIREGRGSGAIVILSCLPDTIDPRGPKEK